MSKATIKWQFEVSTIFPTVRIRGTVFDSSSAIEEAFLISKALSLIEKASKYNGFSANHDIPPIQGGSIMVSFTLLFKDHKSAQSFINTIK